MDKGIRNFLEILSLQQVLRTIPSGLFLVDREQRIVYWNAEAERITGFQAEEAAGQHCSFMEGIPCGQGCGLFDENQEKPIIGVPCSVRSKEGRRLTLLKNVDYLRNSTGEIVGGIESFIDITPQKRLERKLLRQTQELEKRIRQRTAELEEERTWLKTALDAMADLAYITSEEGEVLFMNRAMVDIFGAHAGETCYREFLERSSPCPWCPLPKVKLGRTVREERFLEQTGRFYEIIHTPLKTVDGSVHKLAVYRDITERKEVEERLREANRELDAFAYTVSHDLRTPLTPIIGYAEFLQEEYRTRLDAGALEILNEIENQGIRMLSLIEDLLSLARVGQPVFSPAPVEVTAVVQEVLEDLSEALTQAGAEVVLTSPLPPLNIPASVLSQVFANIIGNAVRYAGQVGKPIEIGSQREGRRNRYFVRDHGPGIPPEERTKIFDLFYRGSTSRGVQGTGIGLGIVRKIARLYGGRAWAEETPGGGITFWVEFEAGGSPGEGFEAEPGESANP